MRDIFKKPKPQPVVVSFPQGYTAKVVFTGYERNVVDSLTANFTYRLFVNGAEVDKGYIDIRVGDYAYTHVFLRVRKIALDFNKEFKKMTKFEFKEGVEVELPASLEIPVNMQQSFYGYVEDPS
jgi:hypothetical protein